MCSSDLDVSGAGDTTISYLILLTDSDNYIIDLHLNEIKDPHALADYLIKEVGVVEHGLFLDMVNTVIVGKQEGPVILHARD